MSYRTAAARFVLGSFIAPLAFGVMGENPHPVDQVNESIMISSGTAGNNNATVQFAHTPSKTTMPLHYNFRYLIPAGNNTPEIG
jgi:hypothetical protein